MALPENTSVYDTLNGGIAFLIHKMAPALECLSRYDTCDFTPTDSTSSVFDSAGGVLPDVDQVRRTIHELRAALTRTDGAGDLFGIERGDGIASLLDNLNQNVFGSDVYPTCADKAANLLYFFVKNHPLSDGNKRCGAFLVNMFLGANGLPTLDNAALTALTLLVAQSKPEERDVTLGVLKFLLIQHITPQSPFKM